MTPGAPANTGGASDSQTVSEVAALFDGKAAGWGDKYGRDGALRERLSAFQRALSVTVAPPAEVFELGCGVGNLAAAVADQGYAVTAADVSTGMLAEAERRFGRSKVTWRALAVDWKTLPADSARFAAVLASSLLEYVPDVAHVLAECARVVRPGGTIVCTVPNVKHPIRRAEAVVLGAVRAFPRFGRRIAQRRRLASYLQYLELSRNRFSLEGWTEQLSGAGLVRQGPPERLGALWLLRAQKAA